MQVEQDDVQTPSFRLDVPLHSLLTKAAPPIPGLHPVGEPQRFPDPVFPQRPELLGPIAQDVAWEPPVKRHWTAGQIYHAMRGWLFPYIRSRVTAGDFHPLIAISSPNSNAIWTATIAGPLTTRSKG